MRNHFQYSKYMHAGIYTYKRTQIKTDNLVDNIS